MNSTRTRAALAGCLAAVAALAAAGLLTGSFPLSFSEILQHPGGLSARVFWQLRLPRTLMGLVGGWALGMAGGVYQTVFANPLASPDLTGVSSGASLGAAAAIVLGAGGRLSVTLFSFAFGMAALAAEASSPALPEGWVWADRAALAREYAVPNAFQPFQGAVEERLGHF